MNSHHRIALLSLLPLLLAPLPILSGGILWAQSFPLTTTVRITAHLPAYYTLLALLALYTLSLAFAFPTRAHRLPHPARSLAHLFSWLYMSRLLADPQFHRVDSKTDLVTRLVAGMAAARSASAENLLLRTAMAGNARGGPVSSNSRGWESLTRLPGSRERLARARVERSEEVGQPRYGFGIFVGRDGLAHLGIDRVHRTGSKMTLFTTVTRR